MQESATVRGVTFVTSRSDLNTAPKLRKHKGNRRVDANAARHEECKFADESADKARNLWHRLSVVE